MKRAVIVDAIRTPMGRSKGGSFRQTRAEDFCFVHDIVPFNFLWCSGGISPPNFYSDLVLISWLN